MHGNDTATANLRETKLDEAAAEQEKKARACLLDRIDAAGGWLSFERFMDLALYAPLVGYYSGGAQKFGPSGDFTTAPEISSLFGACVAVQCEQIMGRLNTASILEIGAGSGRLAADILGSLESKRRLPERYWILEISADLRDRQRAHIARHRPQLLERVQWLDRPPDEPFDGVILANEVLDALPVARFRWHADAIEELGVVRNDGHFAWRGRPAAAAMAESCRRLSQAGGDWDDGYVSEYCPRLVAWTRAVTRSLRNGAALWFDYGLPRAQYYLPERHDGTLLCHFRHCAHNDPFLWVGLQDITAWVDFTLLAEASRECGFQLAGFTTQAHFLAGTGIDSEMQLIAANDTQQFAILANQARRLLLPGEMGERFKAMAWLRGMNEPLRGFELHDMRHTL
jgi:SAM-dependent MidA family methyltransferase